MAADLANAIANGPGESGTKAPWPAIDGNFIVGEQASPVAVCTLTTESLPATLVRVPGVAIAGQVYTANLGIERIVLNITANPSIRFLLLCGKESKVFRPGQSLSALVEDGIDGENRILGAEGYEPVLPNVPASRVEEFRQQIELVDWIGKDDPRALEEQIAGLAGRSPGPFIRTEEHTEVEAVRLRRTGSFAVIRPGGQRQPLQYDPKGYFVITVDREEEQIVLQHYRPDHTPAHEMRGRVAESMVLGLVREDLVSQLSHAGYIGAELAKAEAALHLGLRYKQDRPLTRPPKPANEPKDDPESTGEPAPKSRISPAMNQEQLAAASEGDKVDVVLEATQSSNGRLSGMLAEPNEKSPFDSFRRTDRQLDVRWSDETPIVMGEAAEIVSGGILRVGGVLRAQMLIEASVIVVLSKVATIE